MPKFTMPKWLTYVLAGLYLVVAWLIHRPDIIPPMTTIDIGFIHLQVAVVLTDILLALAAIGINGPQLLPQVAAMLGNPAGKPTAVVPPPSPPDVPR